MERTGKRAAFAAITAFLVCVTCLFGVMPNSARGVKAEEPELLVLQEVDRWNEDGYKIERKSGSFDVSGVAHAYDYVMTVSDEIWLLEGKNGVMKINNVSSRPFIFNVSTQSGIPIAGHSGLNHSSWFACTSTDETIAKLQRKSFKEGRINNLYLELGQTVGQAVITCTIDNRVCDDGEYNGKTVNGTLRILFNCVERENAEFTFTGLEKDRNGNKNAVWLNGINIPEADAEWSKAEEVGDLFNEFYGNIFFLEGNDDGSAKEYTEATDENSLRTILSNKAAGALKFQVEVRSDHIELKKQVRMLENGGAEENGSPIDFEPGDAFYFKKGLYLLGKDGNTNWCLKEEGFVYTVLLRDQFFVYLGEDQGWSADRLGVSISFAVTEQSVDVGASVKLNPSLSGGESLPADKKVVTWTSENPEIATVAADGTVTGVAAGTTKVTATTGTGDFATVDITVMRSDEITAIRLNAANINLNIGGTRTIVATVEGGTTADKSVTWETSDASVATVENGLVTAVGAGTCTITATAADGKTATAKVTVRPGSTDKPDPEPEPKPEPDPEEKKGCSKSAAGMSVPAAIAALGALGAVAIRKKK